MDDFLVDDDENPRPLLTEVVATATTREAAEAVVAQLRSENVRSRVGANDAAFGVPCTFQVLVAPESLHRAKWVLRDPDLTDRELTYLATGEFLPEDDD